MSRINSSILSKRLVWLDGIRFFAAVMILLYHAQLLFIDYAFTPQPTGLISNLEHLTTLNQEASWQSIIGHFFSIPVLFGFQFVDVYVLVSGFSLVLSLRTQHLEPGAFLKKRLLRLLWPFWTITWLSLPILWAIGVATDSYAPSPWHTFVASIFPLLFDYRGELPLPISGPWWFVSLMISFALIFPLLWRLLQRWGGCNLLLVSILLTLGYRALAVYEFGGHPTYVILDTPAAEQPFLGFTAKLSTFVIGMVVAQAYRQGKGPVYWPVNRTIGIGLPLYALGFLCQFSRLGWVLTDLLLPLGLTLLCLAVFRTVTRLNSIRPLILQLGIHSYSFFLMHNFVVDRTMNLVVQNRGLLYCGLLPVMIAGTLFLATLADSLQPLVQRVVMGIFRDVDYLCLQSPSFPNRTWSPRVGDRVSYGSDDNWRVLKIETLLDDGQCYLCKITNSQQTRWVNQEEISLEDV